MAVFTYKATDARDDVSGTIAADTPRAGARPAARARAGGPRYRRLSTGSRRRRKAERATLPAPPAVAGRGLRHQATVFIRELSTLLGVGVPLLEALETIARQHKGRFHSAILLLRDRVAAGVSLAQCDARAAARL